MRAQRGPGACPGSHSMLGQNWDLNQNRRFERTKLSCQTSLCILCASLLLSYPALIWLPSCSSFHFIPQATIPIPLANSGACPLHLATLSSDILYPQMLPCMLPLPSRSHSNVTASERPSLLAGHSLTLWNHPVHVCTWLYPLYPRVDTLGKLGLVCLVLWGLPFTAALGPVPS